MASGHHRTSGLSRTSKDEEAEEQKRWYRARAAMPSLSSAVVVSFFAVFFWTRWRHRLLASVRHADLGGGPAFELDSRCRQLKCARSSTYVNMPYKLGCDRRMSHLSRSDSHSNPIFSARLVCRYRRHSISYSITTFLPQTSMTILIGYRTS